MIALEDGDGARFIRDIKAMISLAHHAEEGKFLISQLVGSAIRSLALERVVLALEWRADAASDAELVQLAAILRAIPQEDYQVDLSIEQWVEFVDEHPVVTDQRGLGGITPGDPRTLRRDDAQVRGTIEAFNLAAGLRFRDRVRKSDQ